MMLIQSLMLLMPRFAACLSCKCCVTRNQRIVRLCLFTSCRITQWASQTNIKAGLLSTLSSHLNTLCAVFLVFYIVDIVQVICGNPQSVSPPPPLSTPPSPTSSSILQATAKPTNFSRGEIAGIVVGLTAGAALLALAGGFYIHRRHQVCSPPSPAGHDDPAEQGHPAMFP